MHVSGRADRPLRAALEGAPTPCPGRSRWRSPSRSSSASSGRRAGRWRWLPGRPDVLNYFYLSPSVALVQEEVRPDQRVLAGALLLLVMNLIGLGLGPTLVGAVSDCFRRSSSAHSLQLAFYTLCRSMAWRCCSFCGWPRAARVKRRSESPHDELPHVASACPRSRCVRSRRSTSPAPPARAPSSTRRPARAGHGRGDSRSSKAFRTPQPPVGPLRWKPPQPMATLDGVRDATAFGAACVQPAPQPGSIYVGRPPPMSEDCLSLNIWTPADAQNAPVFVWIHGGALRRGAGSDRCTTARAWPSAASSSSRSTTGWACSAISRIRR